MSTTYKPSSPDLIAPFQFNRIISPTSTSVILGPQATTSPRSGSSVRCNRIPPADIFVGVIRLTAILLDNG